MNAFTKLLRGITVVSLFVLLLGCVKEVEYQQPQEELHEVVFHAGWAPETKTVLQEDGSVWWTPGDEISLFVGNIRSNYNLTSTNDATSAATDFVGNISEKPVGSHYIAVFPFNAVNDFYDNTIRSEVPEHQKACPGTFDPKAFLSVARSDDETLYFRNVCSGIKFSVSNDGIKKVEFKPYYGGSEEALAGNCEISFDENETPYISSFVSIERSVTLEAPSGEYLIPGQNYYVSIIPGTYSKGLTITYYKDNEKAKYHIDKELIAKKSVIGRIGQLDRDLMFSPYYNSVAVLPSGGLWRYLNGNKVKKICFVNNTDKTTSMQLADDVYYDYVDGTVSFYTSADAFKGADLWGNMPDDIRKGVEDIDLGVFDFSDNSSMDALFADMVSLKRVDMSKVTTKGVDSMIQMFRGCSSLETVDLSNFDTSDVKNMNGMFSGCSSLTSLNTMDFNTSNVTDMNGMFSDCSSLKSLDISSFDTSIATDMSGMFSGCSSLTSLNVSNFNTANVTNMNGMFSGCSSLPSLDLSNFNTAKVEYMSTMFSDCTNLQIIDIKSFDTSNVTGMMMTFNNCLSLKSLDISNFDMSSVVDCAQMFGYCRNMESLNLGEFSISTSTYWNGCFYYMASISRNCNIICGKESIEALYNNPYDPSYFGSSKKYINWYIIGEAEPIYRALQFPDYYQSTDYSRDGEVKVLQQSTEGNGIDVVLMGDGFSDRLIEDGTYDKYMQNVLNGIFIKEPFATYRDMFNVYEVTAVSENENINGNTRFDCNYDGGDKALMRQYALKALKNDSERLKEVAIVIVCNEDIRGVTYLDGPSVSAHSDYGTGVSYMYVPNRDDTGTIVHEWGHAFAKLGDEYDSVNIPATYDFESFQLYCDGGYYKNIDVVNDPSKIKWSKFLTDSRYGSFGLGVFEGAYAFKSGFYRPSQTSIMNSGNISDEFNAPSREAIYYRIHKLAYGDDWQYDYETFVQQDLKNIQAETKVSTESVPYPARVNERKPFFKMEKIRDNDGREMIRMIMN